VQKQ